MMVLVSFIQTNIVLKMVCWFNCYDVDVDRYVDIVGMVKSLQNIQIDNPYIRGR
jgi:hypothetical protein